MASLTDLFNPSFLMFLGILFLSVAGLFLYFEGKMREQNHKISSMVGLISAMAEEMNVVRSNFSLMRAGSAAAAGGIQMSFGENNAAMSNNTPFVIKQNLINVSDDESEEGSESDESEEGSNIEEDSESDSGSESGSDDDDDETADADRSQNEIIQIMDDMHDIKILKLNMETLDNANTEANDADNDSTLDNENKLEELLDNFSDNEIDETDALNEINDFENQMDDNFSGFSNDIAHIDLKSININDLENSKNTDDSVDYKKLSNNALKSIVVEKGLTNDASKLTKGKLLKLLGVE